MSSTIINNNMGFRPADFDRGRMKEQSLQPLIQKSDAAESVTSSDKGTNEVPNRVTSTPSLSQAATFEPSANLQAMRNSATSQASKQAVNEEIASKNEERMEENQEKLAELTQNMQELANMIQANDLSFRKDENSDTIVMVLIDKETEEEVRQIPSELLLKIASRINDFIKENNAKNEERTIDVNTTNLQNNRDKRIDAYLNANRINNDTDS